MKAPTELPLLAVVLVVGAGVLGAGVLDAWRTGSTVVGLGLLLAGGLRLGLPARRAGMLVVRSRSVDTAVLLVLGLAVVGLAGSIPIVPARGV